MDDDDERLVLGATGRFRAEVLPEDSEGGEWRELTATEELVEFYDPTDIFGDLADALAEAFPAIAPEFEDGAEEPAGEAVAEATEDAPPRPSKARPKKARPTRRGRRGRDAAHGRDPDLAPAPEPSRGSSEAAVRAVGAELVERREVVPGQVMTAWHSPSIVSGVRAGQYVHVYAVEAGGLPVRRPFPIVTADAASGTLTIHGPGAPPHDGWLNWLRPGDTVDMIGPLGRPFEVDSRSRHLLLIAEGPSRGGRCACSSTRRCGTGGR